MAPTTINRLDIKPLKVKKAAKGGNGNATITSPQDVLKLAREAGCQVVDVRFTDMPGTWQHFTVSMKEFGEGAFEEGLGFDGSSIRGFQAINESDMLLMPDAASAFVDPVLKVPTLAISCDIVDPITHQPYTRDPRYVARKAEEYLLKSGVADTSYWGPEAEFFIFNSVRYDQNSHEGFYHIDSDEGVWNSGATHDLDGTANRGYKVRHKEGYFPVPPVDRLQDVRSKILLALEAAGIRVEVQHHEVGTAGQSEIDMRFDTLVRMADNVMKYKYIVKNVCWENGLTATFMPKPLFGDNGSGMHVHQSLWKSGTNLFVGKGYAGLSDTARWYIGGLIKHAPSLLAFCAPTTNSYRRLVPGYEAPINLMYSARNRSAIVRIPMYSNNPKAKRLEFRAPDPSANPYLAFAALLMAGLDGVKNKIEPPKPLDKDLYELEGAEKAKIKSTPGSLTEVLDALEKDHDYLTRGDVFTDDLIETWISYKRDKEVKPMALRPHPYEFFLYYDA